MERLDTTHRLHQDDALCGADAGSLSPLDEAVTCQTCLALISLAAQHRRAVVRRSLVVIARLAEA